jgi:flagellar protein FlaI
MNLFDRKNVINMESKYKGSISKITMNDLIINALRMRPDRILVGEVRGEEAESIFNAMNVGHSAMATLHANSSAESMTRLANPPMNVPKEMLGLIDLIVITTKIRTKGGLKRRISSVVEIVRSEIGPSFSELFTYDAKTDSIAKNIVPSQKIERLANLSGLTKTTVINKIEAKKKLLEKMQKEKITGFKEVQEQIKDHYDKEQLTGI